MKKLNILLALTVFTSLWIVGALSVKAQTTPGHVFHINTLYMVSGLDSIDRSVRDAMLKEYLNKVTQKNEFVLHSWSMNHFFTDDSREFLIVSEFANWSDIEKAGNRDDELEKLAWPDAKKRHDFMKKMGSYFTYHKDAIYNALPNLTK